MTRPPEFEQVAEWVNAIDCDPLGGIDLDGKTTAQIAGESHARQIAECAHHERDLLERIRALKSGDFTVPRWCADDAARDGISLAEAIEWYRQEEIHAAREELDHLDCYYAVRDDEIQAYWAGRTDRWPPRPERSGTASIPDFPNGPLPHGPGPMPARAARQPEPQVTRKAR